MRNNEPLHPLQQCLRENGEQIAAAVAESQFREVLEINKQLRARIAELEQSNERLTEYSRQQTEHADEHAAKFTKLEGQRNELNNKLVLLEAASVPERKETGEWESARIGDFNSGWNACRDEMVALLEKAAWMELDTTKRSISIQDDIRAMLAAAPAQEVKYESN